ncbi:MAG: sialidase family protein, partial [Gemmatimonadota bacterium]
MARDHEAPSRPPFLPVPAGVTETTGLPVDGGIVATGDGRLLMLHSRGGPEPGLALRTSGDGGRTWSDPGSAAGLPPGPVNGCGLIRLQSGRLAAYHGTLHGGWFLSTSADAGATWERAGTITTFPAYIPMFHSLVQLQSGRLLLSGYWQTWEPPLGLERLAPTGWGWWKGRRLFMEGHRGPSIGFCFTYHSDDEGRTWRQGPEELVWGIFGWFDERGELNGAGGLVDLYE